MLFYKISVDLPTEGYGDSIKSHSNVCQVLSEETFAAANRDCYIFVSDVQGQKLICGMISRSAESVDLAIFPFLRKLDIPRKSISLTVDEITTKALLSLLSHAEHHDYIGDKRTVLAHFELEGLTGRSGGFFLESILRMPKNSENPEKDTEWLPGEHGLIKELERISANEKQPASTSVHPVHYIICAKEKQDREKTLDILLGALLRKGRMISRRCCTVNLPAHLDDPQEQIRLLYTISEGGVVVLECRNGFLGNEEEIQTLCTNIHKYANRVLTVFCFSESAARLPETLRDLPIVELGEDKLSTKDAKGYLKRLAQKKACATTKNLYQGLKKEHGVYYISELNDIFDTWAANRQKADCFPQYANFAASKGSEETGNYGNALLQLQSLIGLTEAKTVICQMLDFFKLQKMRATVGFPAERPSMHMVFTGNPGTAKTTVGRLVAKIMKENGLLPRGELYEVGRADLIGQYVGSTARLVKDTFNKAKGGVLFIDEAYALVDDRNGLYGDEAINTIVQEMENHRDDTVVIFAGYPDKMEEFLDRNPGLRSRIAFHIPFPDYSTEELYKICETIAEKRQMTLEPGARENLLPLLEQARTQSDFGNGRFVRNLIERAQMNQASRLMKTGIQSVTAECISTLIAEDFEMPEIKPQQPARHIGFVLGI